MTTGPRLSLVKALAPPIEDPPSPIAGKSYDPAMRGYVVHHKTGCECPGCGRSSWLIGRQSAECAWCWTAIPLGRQS